MYIYRPGGTPTANGNPNLAYFAQDAGRTAINDLTDPSGFLSSGAAGGLRIHDIGPAGETISFQVDLPPLFGTTGEFVKYDLWNLVSIPVDPIQPDPSVVLGGIIVSCANLQFWRNDVEGGGYQQYGSLWGWAGPMLRGSAYWLKELGSGPDKDISFYGTPPSTDFELTIPAHITAPFWITLGTPFPNAVPADTLRFKNVSKRGDVWLDWVEAYSDADLDLGIVESCAMGWDAVMQSYVSVSHSHWESGASHRFDPWHGYWMMVRDPSELKIKFPKPPDGYQLPG